MIPQFARIFRRGSVPHIDFRPDQRLQIKRPFDGHIVDDGMPRRLMPYLSFSGLKYPSFGIAMACGFVSRSPLV
jgi:hypothetical protein